MKTTAHLLVRRVLWLLLLAFAFALPLAAAEMSEEQVIAQLGDKNGDKAAAAMQAIEKKFPTSVEGLKKIKSMLGDDRVKVRRKAARVVGALHADVTEAELRQIAGLLKGKTPEEVIDGLKSLRGLRSKPVIPEITALLTHPTPNVIRDACRTLADIGTRDLIPAIEPLLNHAHAAVKKDAQDAIFKLKNK